MAAGFCPELGAFFVRLAKIIPSKKGFLGGIGMGPFGSQER